MSYKVRKLIETNKSGVVKYPPPKIVHSSDCQHYKTKLPTVSEDCKNFDCYLCPRGAIIPFDKSYLELSCGLAFHDAINHLNLSPELITLTINALSEVMFV